MLVKASATVVTVIVVGFASTSLARDGGGPPTIDIQKTCRENISALSTGLGGEINQDLKVCLADEQAARDQLVKDWATYSALAKSRCVNPKEYLPGYIEWQTCLEMTQGVINMRKERASGTSGSNASGTPGSIASDTPGSIASDTSGSKASGTSGSKASGTSGSSASRRTSRSRGGAVTGDCPVVKYSDDGSIDYVINCPGPGMPGLNTAR
jgi:hypothetical protein